jgi:hypothetical protein
MLLVLISCINPCVSWYLDKNIQCTDLLHEVCTCKAVSGRYEVVVVVVVVVVVGVAVVVVVVVVVFI